MTETHHPSRPGQPQIHFRLTRFDTIVAGVIAVLLGAIILTILLGDRVGVQIERFAPIDAASSTAAVTLTFNEMMNWDSVIQRLQFSPPIDGDFNRGSRTLRFIPAEPLEPGETYRVSLIAGAESSSGRKVLRETTFDFRIRTPRVAYLAPADAVPQNIWLSDPYQPDSAEQLTASPTGVLNFDVSSDGTRIAFAERSEFGTSDIKLLDLETRTLRQLTNCVDADCNTPVWRPDGSMIAYQRIDLNSDFTQLGVSPTRVWLIDMTTTPPIERPLFTDSQILGYSPQWSADGSRIAVFDNNSRGILVYNMDDGSLTLIPSRSGSDMALSPDGTRLIFPRLIFDDDQAGARSILQSADLIDGAIADLIDPNAPVDDTQAVWNPDGRHLAIARRYTDERATRTRQIVLLDTETGATEDLIFDVRYFNGFFSWDPQGAQLVIQRFPEMTTDGEFNSSGRPEVWTYHLVDETLLQVAQNAYLPQWVP
jgi:Tol biopolymer transport system component